MDSEFDRACAHDRATKVLDDADYQRGLPLDQRVECLFSALREAEEAFEDEYPYGKAAREIAERADMTAGTYGPFAGPHEAYGVIFEEVCEFFDEARQKNELRLKVRMRAECIDIAVAALRYAVQLDREMGR